MHRRAGVGQGLAKRGRNSDVSESYREWFVMDEAAVVSGEAAALSRNAAVACQLIRATASLATGVSYIASVLSVGARVFLGFARVA